jgi:hypothetical protein
MRPRHPPLRDPRVPSASEVAPAPVDRVERHLPADIDLDVLPRLHDEREGSRRPAAADTDTGGEGAGEPSTYTARCGWMWYATCSSGAAADAVDRPARSECGVRRQRRQDHEPMKCLHALAAHALAAGPGGNPAGDLALAEAASNDPQVAALIPGWAAEPLR